MKYDSSRFTFAQRKHFASVLMQQGRVQVDADWNEQGEIFRHRVETEAGDIIGLCGGPLHHAAFHIVPDLNHLTAEEKNLQGNKSAPSNFKVPDFLISAGRYYVDGILCENEQLTSYLNQPDLPNAPPLTAAGLYLIYVDVWERLLTCLDDPSIRETALGGPDTATRAKIVWQVKSLFLGALAEGNCLTKFPQFEELIAPSSGKLSARTEPGQTSTDPCIVPPGAGYRGLGNQLYRVEIHQGGAALDETSAAGITAKRVLETIGQVTQWAIATYKWSRENGVTATTIKSIDSQDHKKITVHDVGPDAELGFNEGQWVEITDDVLELNGQPGQLAWIVKIDPATNLITLSVDASLPNGLDHNPKLRGWHGVGVVKFHSASTADDYIDLENGVQVRFFDGTYKTGDYWTIAARTANADAQSGNIEWPQEQNGSGPLAQAAFGIKHHYCRLAMLRLVIGLPSRSASNEATAGIEQGRAVGKLSVIWPVTRFAIEDCRQLFPSITELTSLFFAGGDGQEAMPNDPLPQPLRAGVFNARWPVPGARVRFTAEGKGQLAKDKASLTSGSPNVFDALAGPDGIASCAWQLEPDVSKPSQHVEARLLDADLQPTPATVGFNGNLSIADQVYYNPGECGTLKNQGTVQMALSRLSQLSSLYKISGDGQEIMPGETVAPLKVLVASPCGVSGNAEVTFKIVEPGKGKVGNGVSSIVIGRGADGFWSCAWKPDLETPFQEVEASITGDATTPPVTVRFSLNLSKADHVSYNPDPKDCPDLAKAKVTTVQAALNELCKRGKSPEEPGIHIQSISAGYFEGKPRPLLNDTLVPVGYLADGVTIVCDQPIAPSIAYGNPPQTSFPLVAPKPTCFVTLDLPSPVNIYGSSTFGVGKFGFHPMILASNVELVADTAIRWFPTQPANDWLGTIFAQGSALMNVTDRLLAHLTLKGNFMVSSGTEPEMWLDGEAFAIRNSNQGAPLNLRLPSGDGRRGGDFEMWFWLVSGRLGP